MRVPDSIFVDVSEAQSFVLDLTSLEFWGALSQVLQHPPRNRQLGRADPLGGLPIVGVVLLATGYVVAVVGVVGSVLLLAAWLQTSHR